MKMCKMSVNTFNSTYSEAVYQILSQSEWDLFGIFKRFPLEIEQSVNQSLTFSNRQLKSTCIQTPVFSSNSMFSPCRSPSLKSCKLSCPAEGIPHNKPDHTHGRQRISIVSNSHVPEICGGKSFKKPAKEYGRKPE